MPRKVEHRAEVGRERERHVQLDRFTPVEVHVDPLLEGALVEPAPLDPDLNRLQRQPAAAKQLEVGIGQLVHRPGAGRRRNHEQPWALARETELVPREEPCLVAVDTEGMVVRRAASRHRARSR